ncbi:MAG: alpha/beta hydrolase [Phycisphaeraceae bacterium]|nr:MAG: alpha/beta hydrolase [Phycisphaeraceae bacterium]
MNIGERLAYFPSREPFVTPPGVEDVEFASADGTTLHGWFMPAFDAAPGERRPVVLHAHGNAGHVGWHAGFSAFLRERGVHVLLFDYRGYGRSDDARQTRRALLDDTRAALACLRARPDVDADRIGMYGVSLGGAFALPAAAEDTSVRAVVTLSAFSTWRGTAHDMLPVVGPMLIHGGLDPEDAAAGLGDRPYLIVHGDEDGVIHVRHAQRLFEAATEAGVTTELVIVPRADHNTIIDRHADARDAIGDFFVEHLGVRSEHDP